MKKLIISSKNQRKVKEKRQKLPNSVVFGAEFPQMLRDRLENLADGGGVGDAGS